MARLEAELPAQLQLRRTMQPQRSPLGSLPLRAALAASVLIALFTASCQAADVQVIKITAKRFEFIPKDITLKKGVEVILQLRSEDRVHGFNIPAMNLRVDVPPDKTTEIKLKPMTAGKFDFNCDVFCGSGHEDMGGEITVTE